MSGGNKKTIMNWPRVGGVYQPLPEELTVIGIDTDHNSRKDGDPKGHPFYDERVHLPREKGKVMYDVDHGPTKTVLVVKDGDKAIVIDGRQSVLDLREANKIRLERGLEPWRIEVKFERGEEAALVRLSNASNALATPEDPVTEASKINDYFRQYGRTPEAIRDMENMYRCSITTIDEKLKLLELDSKVVEAIRKGQLSATAALKLHGLSRDEQRAKLTELFSDPANLSATGKVKVTAIKRSLGKGGAPRPKKKVLVAVTKHEEIAKETRDAIAWALGELNDEQATRRIPGLKAAIEAAAFRRNIKGCEGICGRSKAQLRKDGSSLGNVDGKAICDQCAGRKALAKDKAEAATA